MRISQQRDGRWFETTYRTHELAVRRYVTRRIGADQADDLVAEVFTTLWRRRDDAPERVLPWLYGVAANHISHAARTHARADRLTHRIANQRPAEPAPESHFEGDELFRQLSEPDAELLRLAYWEELEPADIAVVLGCAPRTARVRLHRARKRAESQLASTITPRSVIPDEQLEAEEVQA